MPLSVVLQGIDRTRRLDQAFPSKTSLEHLLPFSDTSFPMLGWIDPYGNTIFSGVQMQLFIPEWDRLMQNVTDKDDTEFLSSFTNYSEATVPSKVVGEMAMFRQAHELAD